MIRSLCPSLRGGACRRWCMVERARVDLEGCVVASVLFSQRAQTFETSREHGRITSRVHPTVADGAARRSAGSECPPMRIGTGRDGTGEILIWCEIRSRRRGTEKPAGEETAHDGDHLVHATPARRPLLAARAEILRPGARSDAERKSDRRRERPPSSPTWPPAPGTGWKLEDERRKTDLRRHRGERGNERERSRRASSSRKRRSPSSVYG